MHILPLIERIFVNQFACAGREPRDCVAATIRAKNLHVEHPPRVERCFEYGLQIRRCTKQFGAALRVVHGRPSTSDAAVANTRPMKCRSPDPPNLPPQEHTRLPITSSSSGRACAAHRKAGNGIERRRQIRIPISDHRRSAPHRDSHAPPHRFGLADIGAQPQRAHLPRMLLPQPLQYERRVVGTSVVDEHERDVRRVIEKIAERLRSKPLRLVEARHDDEDVLVRESCWWSVYRLQLEVSQRDRH